MTTDQQTFDAIKVLTVEQLLEVATNFILKTGVEGFGFTVHNEEIGLKLFIERIDDKKTEGSEENSGKESQLLSNTGFDTSRIAKIFDESTKN